MKHTYSSLTPMQSRAVQASYARLLVLSRKRRVFAAHCKALGWPAPHIPELWAAFMTAHYGDKP